VQGTSGLDAWATSRVGHGSSRASWWFIGPDETCAESEVRARLENGAFTDLREAFRRLETIDGSYRNLFEQPLRLDPTWRKFVRAFLVANARPTSEMDLETYQANTLGRPGGDTVLVSLRPPRPRGAWPYAAPGFLTGEPVSEERFEKEVLPARMDFLRQQIRDHSPEVVIAHGERGWPLFKAMLGRSVPWAPLHLRPPRNWGEFVEDGDQLVVLAPGAAGPQADMQWHQLGEFIKERKGGAAEGRMTASSLVKIVGEIGTGSGQCIVSSRDIMAWCRRQRPPVDYGAGRKNEIFWQRDLDEARSDHRLIKFKLGSEPTDGTFFALKKEEKAALREAALRGLYSVPWNADARNSPLGGIGNWEWQEATKVSDEDE
jgi:hypothetical protein